MVQSLARHAIDIAVDATPHKPREGQRVFSLIEMLPAARQRLGESGLTITAPPVEADVDFTDGRGHSRPIYRCLAFHLAASAGAPATPQWSTDEEDVSLTLWREVVSPSTDTFSKIEAIANTCDSSLHEQALDDGIDFWTYREMVGVHALHLLAQRYQREDWQQRVVEITNYHQHHTQPDYTTYQPWGLAAFLSNPDTIMFGEQQLHDVQTHLQIEGGAGAVLPALLLADAYASLKS